jgi:hypothetical protein
MYIREQKPFKEGFFDPMNVIDLLIFLPLTLFLSVETLEKSGKCQCKFKDFSWISPR